MTDELKNLIEAAAKLLGYRQHDQTLYENKFLGTVFVFNPLDPERGDLMKVAMVAKLIVDCFNGRIYTNLPNNYPQLFTFTKGDPASLALAVLRAASAVLKSRGGE